MTASYMTVALSEVTTPSMSALVGIRTPQLRECSCLLMLDNERDCYIKGSIFSRNRRTRHASAPECTWFRHYLNAELHTRGQNSTSESFHPCEVIVTLGGPSAWDSDGINSAPDVSKCL